MLHKLLNIFTSLRLTVVCLILALGLVFIGTIAQVKLGLYIVQEQYFSSFFIWWAPGEGSFKIPIYPGGFLIGGVLLINLIAAHIKRFELSRKKAGIFVIHAGLILLLVGQLLTQLYQVESYMAIEEGESKNYSENGRLSELAVKDVTDEETDFVVAIPQQKLAREGEISHKELPFKVRVKEFYENADPNISGANVTFKERPFETAMDRRNVPAAFVEIVTDEGVKGPFEVSNWKSEKNLVLAWRQNMGQSFSPEMIKQPTFTYKDRTYELALRPIRYYKDFTIQLKDFTHDRYKGTEIPKNFSSRIRLVRPETNEDRELLIYMNNPLRYGGETFYQGGFEPGDTVSILQVVRNPSWITPYIACTLVGAGLLIQFLSHLIKFSKKKRSA